MSRLPKSMQKRDKSKTLSLPFVQSFSLKQLVSFTRSMAVLIKARLPLVRALKTVSSQIDNSDVSSVLENVKTRVEQGQSLAEALQSYPDIFSSSYIYLVKVGEQTGTLADMLERLAESLEKRQQLRQKVRSAMMYPGLVFAVSMGAFFFLLTVVVPSFSELYTDFEAEMPYLTSLVLQLSNFFTIHFWYIILGVFGIILSGWIFGQTYKGKYLLDRLILKMPFLGTILLKNITASYAHTLGTLLKNGVDLLESLTLVEKTQQNSVFVQATKKFKEAVKKGKSFSSVVKKSSIFPPMAEQMITVGEETAHLDELLLHISESYAREVDIKVENLTSILEPVLIIFLGILVGSIIIALYLPIFDLMNVVQ